MIPLHSTVSGIIFYVLSSQYSYFLYWSATLHSGFALWEGFYFSLFFVFVGRHSVGLKVILSFLDFFSSLHFRLKKDTCGIP